MAETLREVSKKFSRLLDQLPSHVDLAPGQLLGLSLKGEGRWQIAIAGFRWRPPKETLRVVLISEGRRGENPRNSFVATKPMADRLWEVVHAHALDHPYSVRPGQIVAVTWEHPDENWYVGEVEDTEDGYLGFPTDDDTYGPISHHGMDWGGMVIPVSDPWSPKDWRPGKKERRS